MRVNAYAAYETGKELKEYTYELNELPDDYVDVKVSHCGLCYSDIKVIDGAFPVPMPVVPGHEVVGTIHAVGKNIKSLKVGDRVGCHNVRSCCNECSNCHRGYDHMCVKLDALAGGGGGFGEYVRMQSSFVYPIPDGFPSEYAAPLMCAGVTMWASLRDTNVRAGDRVAVLGIGGLGHIGLMLAKAMGCEVTAISTSPNKEDEAKKLGAHNFVVLSEEADVKKFQNYFDFIIITATKELDFVPLIRMLRFKGTLVIAGLPGASMNIPTGLSLFKGSKVVSVAGSTRNEQRQMIEFCAKHKIYPQIELMPISKINEAIERVKKNLPRYRVVLTYSQ